MAWYTGHAFISLHIPIYRFLDGELYMMRYTIVALTSHFCPKLHFYLIRLVFCVLDDIDKNSKQTKDNNICSQVSNTEVQLCLKFVTALQLHFVYDLIFCPENLIKCYLKHDTHNLYKSVLDLIHHETNNM